MWSAFKRYRSFISGCSSRTASRDSLQHRLMLTAVHFNLEIEAYHPIRFEFKGRPRRPFASRKVRVFQCWPRISDIIVCIGQNGGAIIALAYKRLLERSRDNFLLCIYRHSEGLKSEHLYGVTLFLLLLWVFSERATSMYVVGCCELKKKTQKQSIFKKKSRENKNH